MSIGARSQSARTYLEKSIDELGDCELEPLVAHGLRALRDTLPNEVDLTNKVKFLGFSPCCIICHKRNPIANVFCQYISQIFCFCRMYQSRSLVKIKNWLFTKIQTWIDIWNSLQAKKEGTR